jgi:hypothetical protein
MADPTTELNITEVDVADERVVRIPVSGAPLLHTAGGRNPIAPERVEITMWAFRRWGSDIRTSIDITGPRVDGPKKGDYLTRCFGGPDAADAPEWARQLAKQHQPTFGDQSVLAGRTVVELPQPDGVQDERGATWTVTVDNNATSFTAFRHWDDNSPVVETDFALWDPTELRVYCLAGLASSEHALGLAAEPSGVSAQRPRFREGHRVRAIRMDRVGTVVQEDPLHGVDIGVRWDNGERCIVHPDGIEHMTAEPSGDGAPACPGCGSADPKVKRLVPCGLPCDYGWHEPESVTARSSRDGGQDG